MAHAPRILALAGSTRKGSYNRRLLQVAIQAAEEAGAAVTDLDLKEYPLPLFNQDLQDEEGLPENARKLKQLFVEHDGLLIASPEYNSSITPLLKNTIDWISRKEDEDEPFLVAFKGKVAGLISASPGSLGGLRSLVHVRDILGNIGVIVIPEQYALSKAHEAFTDDGALRDESASDRVANVAERLVRVTERVG